VVLSCSQADAYPKWPSILVYALALLESDPVQEGDLLEWACQGFIATLPQANGQVSSLVCHDSFLLQCDRIPGSLQLLPSRKQAHAHIENHFLGVHSSFAGYLLVTQVKVEPNSTVCLPFQLHEPEQDVLRLE
jgi:hypothetical protein